MPLVTGAATWSAWLDQTRPEAELLRPAADGQLAGQTGEALITRYNLTIVPVDPQWVGSSRRCGYQNFRF